MITFKVPHSTSPGKCKLKGHRDTTAHLLEWPNPQLLTAANAGILWNSPLGAMHSVQHSEREFDDFVQNQICSVHATHLDHPCSVIVTVLVGEGSKCVVSRQWNVNIFLKKSDSSVCVFICH